MTDTPTVTEADKAAALIECPILPIENSDRDVGLARASRRNGYAQALADARHREQETARSADVGRDNLRAEIKAALPYNLTREEKGRIANKILRLIALSTPPADHIGDANEMVAPADDGGVRSALATIQAMIGNVDHGKGHGHNAAEMRGGMLNDIRDIARQALSGGAE